jgi:pimeloyl-ACP methyl ester carboxylesterase
VAHAERADSPEVEDLVISCLVRAPRATVWRAWTEPQLLKQWWCPRPWTTEVRAFELRAGGAFHTFMRGPDGDTSDNPGSLIDGIAARHHVIVFDNRGVGASTGSPADSIEQMADDAITFIKGMGFGCVDLFGFSMGGMVAQDIVLKEPQLVRKMILAGTGPAGGEGISAVVGVASYDLLRGLFTGQDPKQYLFFTRTPQGIEAGKAFLARLKERSQHRDKEIAVGAYMAQLRALNAWGRKKPANLSVIRQPVLIVNGDDDRMVPTPNSHDLARRLPESTLVIYPDSGHGGVFQNHADFVPKALEFLTR